MSVAIITGAAGLIGSEASRHFAGQGLDVIGIDNDLRKVFFGEEASTDWNRKRLQSELGSKYLHHSTDIRDFDALRKIFSQYGSNIRLVIHTAAQPSHDWAARDPHMDFSVNANGTLNLLQATRELAPEAVFIFTSTNKVYGDRPNTLPLIEQETRWEIDPSHPYSAGIAEDMSIDQSKHSLFGASKVAADVLVQEYGRYFGIRTACFRGGCLTGPSHSGTELHGFLSYLVKCGMTGREYKIYGYKGKQVRDNIHSADLIRAFDAFFRAPRIAEVYNMGGGRFSNCSMLEAIRMVEKVSGRPFRFTYQDDNRIGDHIWYVSDLRRFQSHYPTWKLAYDCPKIIDEIYNNNLDRWK